MKKKEKEKQKRQISEEQRKSLLQRLELARAANPFHNPALRESIEQPIQEAEEGEEQGSKSGLKPYLSRYLDGPKSVKDFEALRKDDPEKALSFAKDVVWSAKSGGKNVPKGNIGILIRVLSGQPDTPQPIVSDKDIPADNNGISNPGITDIVINNQEVE